MEVKKNPKIDLSRKRGMFFNVGLAVSLSFVLASFEWIGTRDEGMIVLQEKEQEFEELIDIPNTVIPPPPPPLPVSVPEIIVVDEDEPIEEVEIIFDTEFVEDMSIEDDVFEPIDEEEAEEVVDFAEVNPTPVGGLEAFYSYVGKNIRYPPQARRIGIEGKVFVQFVVSKDGSITEVKVVKGIGGGCDEEAIKILEKSPKWKPGKQAHRPVNVRMIIPITFRLN